MANNNRITKGEASAGKFYTETNLTFSDNSKISSYLLPMFGAVSRTTAGTVETPLQETYYPTGISANFYSESNLMTQGTAGTFALKSTSDEDRLLWFYASYDAKTVSGNNKVLGIKLAKNGTPIDETECRAFTGSSAEEAKLVTSWIIPMSKNDEIELYIANITGTENIQVSRGRVIAHDVYRQTHT